MKQIANARMDGAILLVSLGHKMSMLYSKAYSTGNVRPRGSIERYQEPLFIWYCTKLFRDPSSIRSQSVTVVFQRATPCLRYGLIRMTIVVRFLASIRVDRLWRLVDLN